MKSNNYYLIPIVESVFLQDVGDEVYNMFGHINIHYGFMQFHKAFSDIIGLLI